MRITRRQLLTGIAGGFLVALGGTAAGFAALGPEPFIVATLRRHFVAYQLSAETASAFARDFALYLKGGRRFKFALFSLPLALPIGLRTLFPRPLDWRFVYAQREIVTTFVLSTNICEPGFTQAMPIAYRGYDPSRLCNPFASRRTETI